MPGPSLFRAGSIPTNLKGWWKMDELTPNIVTANGNAQVDTAQSKFGGASALFDGTGDYLLTDASNDFNFGTGDFTIDFWVRFNNTTTGDCILSNNYYTLGKNGNWSFIIGTGTGSAIMNLYTYDGQSSAETAAASGLTITTGTWYHVAIVRSGNTIQFYLDGTAVTMDASTITKSLGDTTPAIKIGRDGANFDLDGWIDELRISTVARYSSGFTPETSAYSTDDDTVLLLHMDGSDGSTTFTDSSRTYTRADSSGNGNDLTDNNTIPHSTNEYFPTGEGSALLTHTNTEFFSITDAAQTGLDPADAGSGKYTIAGFFKMNSTSVNQTFASKYNDGTHNAFIVLLKTTGDIAIYVNSSSQTTAAGAGTFLAHKWYHLAVVFDTVDNLITIYLNGVVVHTFNWTGSFHAGDTAPFRIGAYASPQVSYASCNFWDMGVWADALTPLQIRSLALGVDLSSYAYRPGNVSTEPTSWWKCNEISAAAGAITRADTQAASHDLTDNNTVGTGYGYNEGAGADLEATNSEYLSVADHTDFDVSGGVWSFSAMIRLETLNVPIFSQATDANNYIRADITGGVLKIYVVSGGSTVVEVTGATTLVTGVWYHVCFVEDGDTWKIYLDGQDDTASGGTDTDRAANYTGDFRLGANQSLGAFFDGIMADVAWWKGYAVTAAEAASLACGVPIQQLGIVAYYKCNESDGDLIDSIGNHDITEVGTVGANTGLVAGAREGDNDVANYFKLLNADAEDFQVNYPSIMLAVKFDVKLQTDYLWNMDDGSDELYLYKDGGGGAIVFQADAVNTSLATSFITAGEWAHITAIWDGAQIRLSGNAGEVTGSATKTGQWSGGGSADIYVGIRHLLTSPMDGLIDELLYLSRYPRDVEMKTVWNKIKNGKQATSEEISSGGAAVSGGFFGLF